MNINKIVRTTLVTSLIVFSFAFPLIYVKGDNSDTMRGTIELESTSTVILQYNYYKQTNGYSDSDIDWEYETNDTSIGLVVWAMDEDDYDDYKDSLPYTKYILYSGYAYIRSGNWEVHHDDTWYVMLINWDADNKTVLVEYEITFNTSDFFGEFGWIFFPIGMVVFIAICSGISKSQQQAKARRVQQNKQTATSPYKIERAPEQKKSDMFTELDSKSVESAKPVKPPPQPAEPKSGAKKYCSLCGEKLDFDASFCHACGSKLDN